MYSQPSVCSNTLTVSSPNLSSSPALNELSQAIGQAQATMAQDNCSYVNARPLMAKSKRFDDIVKPEAAPFVFKEKILTNSEKLQKFRSDWGNKAIASGQISPVYFDTYRSILSIPLLPDNVSKEEYDRYVDTLAYMIKAWYVNARYAGDLAQLAVTIDRDRPQWSPPSMTASASATASEGFCGSSWRLNETAMFGLVVGLGLVGICFWKACK